MDNPLGIATCLFRDFAPDRHLPLLAELGIRHVELSSECYPLFQDRQKLKHLATVLADTGIAVNSIHVPYYSPNAPTFTFCTISDDDAASRRLAMEMVDLCLDSLVTLGGSYLIVHPSGEPIAEAGAEREEKLDLCRRNLSILAERAEGTPAMLAAECLPRTCLGHNSRELISIVDGVGSKALGVCLDVNHANLYEDVLEATRRYGERILTLHISDNDGLDDRHWLPTRGVIPWQAWAAALSEVGFRGPLTYEIVPRAFAQDGPLTEREMLLKIQEITRQWSSAV